MFVFFGEASEIFIDLVRLGVGIQRPPLPSALNDIGASCTSLSPLKHSTHTHTCDGLAKSCAAANSLDVAVGLEVTVSVEHVVMVPSKCIESSMPGEIQASNPSADICTMVKSQISSKQQRIVAKDQ